MYFLLLMLCTSFWAPLSLFLTKFSIYCVYDSHHWSIKITGLETPEPIAAEICMPIFQDVKSSKRLLILDRVVDPGNLGTLLRTALAFDWVLAIKYEHNTKTDPITDKTEHRNVIHDSSNVKPIPIVAN